MKVTILNSYDENRIPGLIQRSIKDPYIQMGSAITYYDLNELKIASCKGCYKCWLKTPGQCVINDDGVHIAQSFIQSDLAVFVTPISFGCYSHQLKRTLERCIPLISPSFIKVHGEYHHKKRYEKYPDLVVIGILEKPDDISEQIIFDQVKRNAINFYSPHSTCILIYEHQCDEEINEVLSCLFSDSWREKVWIEK